MKISAKHKKDVMTVIATLLPVGVTASYRGNGTWSFPIGAVVERSEVIQKLESGVTLPVRDALWGERYVFGATPEGTVEVLLGPARSVEGCSVVDVTVRAFGVR